MPKKSDPESGSKPRASSSRVYVIAAIFVCLAALGIGILIGRFAIYGHDGDISAAPPAQSSAQYMQALKDADPEISDLLIKTIDNAKIEEYLKNITAEPHIAGTHADYKLVAKIKQDMLDFGLDSVSIAPYEVLLSYPNPERPNTVQIVNSSNQAVLFDSRTEESDISNKPGVVPPFHAYSPAAELTGDLIYVNYGRVQDYDFLANRSINVTGMIVIARYGRIFRGSKVDIAARNGAKGIIIYSDPKDYTWPKEDVRVFPDTVWLPPKAAQRGSVFGGNGDPLTPGFPSIRSAYRFKENDTDNVPLPRIPSHPIGYGAAVYFMRDMEGDVVPEDWRGGMNVTYKFGPLRTGLSVRMNITTTNSIRKVENVIGIIKGQVEPDRYVLMGNHRDAWVYGALDPSSGTAVMMEVARAMGQIVKSGRWRPRRSIMFCSWGAEEYGLIGSMEWAEQYVKSLNARAVAYVNTDVAVEGNHSLRVGGTPLMYRGVYEATMKIPNPKVDNPNDTRQTIYDVWLASFPSKDSPNLPEIGSLGSGSDFAPMLQIGGITSVDLSYTYDSHKYDVRGYPLYHTEYETFETVKKLYDREFKVHQAMSRLSGELLRYYADSRIIPFNVSDYAEGLKVIQKQLDKDFGHKLQQNLGNYSDLVWAIQEFSKDVVNFEQTVANLDDTTDPMAIRMVNDQLLLLEKSFLDPNGLPSRPQKKHLLFAESSNDAYAASSFPGLVDLLFEIDKRTPEDQQQQWQKINLHFSTIVGAIQAAGFTLRDVTRFVEEKYFI